MPDGNAANGHDLRAVWLGARRGLYVLGSLALLSTLLTSCQFARDAATRLTTEHVDGPRLEGTYRLIYDGDNGRANGIAQTKVQSDKVLWAFRSECQKSGCIATGTALDRDNARAPLSPALTIVLRYSDGRWQGLPAKVPVITPGTCVGPGNAVIGQATVTTAETWQFWPNTDGTLTGQLNATALTNDCGTQGISVVVPLTGTRSGDVAPEIKVPDPDVAARDFAPGRRDPAGPLFNSVYSFELDGRARTRNGLPSPAGSVQIELWAMRSLCNTATHCIATGVEITGLWGAKVIESAGQTWQSLSPQPVTVGCMGMLKSTGIAELTLDTSDPQEIRGTETITIVSNECGDRGAVYSTPVAVRNYADEPPPNVEAADPQLFLP